MWKGEGRREEGRWKGEERGGELSMKAEGWRGKTHTKKKGNRSNMLKPVLHALNIAGLSVCCGVASAAHPTVWSLGEWKGRELTEGREEGSGTRVGKDWERDV